MRVVELASCADEASSEVTRRCEWERSVQQGGVATNLSSVAVSTQSGIEVVLRAYRRFMPAFHCHSMCDPTSQNPGMVPK